MSIIPEPRRPYSFEPDFIWDGGRWDFFNMLANDLAWVQREAPRREYWTNTLDRPYTYGRGAGLRTYEPQPPHPMVESISDKLEDRLGFRYEGCFLNFYKDEHDSLGWHADDDPSIDHRRPIAVVTLGWERDIMIRPSTFADFDKENPIYPKQDVYRITLTPGSLLLMKAGMQQTHQHRIPKGSRACGPRISLTYRSLV